MQHAKPDSVAPQALPRRLLVRLNSIDRLYLGYLFFMAILAVARSGLWPFFVFAHVFIAACIVVLAANVERSPVIRFLHDWYPVAMFIFSFEEVARFSLSLVPRWQDHRLIALEDWLFGLSPNLWFSRFHSPWLSELMDLGYFSYFPMFPVAGGLLYPHQDKRFFRQLVLCSVLMYFLSFAIYLALPTEGPRHALPSLVLPARGWLFSWLVRFIQHNAGVHGNAFPSSHVGLALLCVVFAWRAGNKRTAFVCALCLIGISAGAVYDSYHYFIDVVGGIVVAVLALMIGRLLPTSPPL